MLRMLKTWDNQILHFGLVLPRDLNFEKRPADLDGWKGYGKHLRYAIHEIDEGWQKARSEHAEKTEFLPEYDTLRAWALGDWLVEGVKGGLEPNGDMVE